VNLSLTVRCLLSAAVVAAIFWVASRRTFFGDSISSVFLGIALFSIFLILVRTRFSWRELAGVLILSGLIYWMDIRLLGYPYSWPVLPSSVGIAALVVLALRAIWCVAAERRVTLLTFCAAFLFVASEWCASYFLLWGERIRPRTLDLYLYSFDASLGVQPAVVLGQMFARFPWFGWASTVIYIGLPIALGLAFAGCVVRNQTKALRALVAFLITGPIGACFYTMFPALGPVHLFLAKFPWHTLTVDQARRLFLEPISLPGPRNAIPSLHAAWVFLAYWYARKLSIVERIGAAIFVFFTLCSTLGTGEHYFVDLVVAVPFTVMILSIAQAVSLSGRRLPWAAFLYGAGVTLLWFALLRYAAKSFWVSPVLPWMACLITIISGWYFASALELPETRVEMLPSEAPAA